MSGPLRGVFAAPLAPMRADLSVDHAVYVDHCRALLAAGCDGLMPIGSTGEAHSLTVDERCRMIDALGDSGLPMEKMLIGASSLAFPDAIRLVRHAVEAGAGGVCVQPPFYYKPAETVGLLDFFARVIEGVADERLRLYVYDWEGNLGVHFDLDFFHRLFEAYPTVAVGIKDSSGDAAMLEERCRAFPDREVFAGTDSMTLTCLRAGGVGVMSGACNIAPDLVTAIYRNFETAAGAAAQARIDAMRAAMGGLPWFSALKSTLAWLSGDAAWLNARPAIRRLTAEEETGLRERLTALGFAPGAARATAAE